MPFVYCRSGYNRFILKPIESPCRDLPAIDSIILERVLPRLQWEYAQGDLRLIEILPNRRPTLSNHTGPTKKHHPQKFFALGCLEQGLTLPETGLWLDTFSDPWPERKTHQDGIKRIVHPQSASILRLDARRPIYFLKDTPRGHLEIREIT